MATPLIVSFDSLVETSRALRHEQREFDAVRSTLIQHWSRLDAGMRTFTRADIDRQYADADAALLRVQEQLNACAVALLVCVNTLSRADDQAARKFGGAGSAHQ
jgi:hypothetical protein